MKVLLVGEGASELGGALETLVKRLGLPDAEFTCQLVSQQNIHAHHGKGKGYFKRAVRWMLEAKKRDFDVIVLLIDEDGLQERFKEIQEAQEHSAVSIRRALGVAVRSFDAWMLSDEKALSAILGNTVDCQPDPESIRLPKQACDNLMDHSDLSRGEFYAAIAQEVDLQILKTRCPKGFAPFAERVRDFSA